MAERQFRTLVEQLPVMVYSEPFAVGGSRMGQPVGPDHVRLHSRGVRAEELLEDPAAPRGPRGGPGRGARCEQTGEPFCMEYRTLHRDGRVRWIRDECRPHPRRGRHPLYWQGVIVDITDAKRALEHEREVSRRLRAVGGMKNTFLDAVSHELRTPWPRSSASA